MLLQTGAAYVSIERIHNLYRVILLGIDNVESRARRGKRFSLYLYDQHMPTYILQSSLMHHL